MSPFRPVVARAILPPQGSHFCAIAAGIADVARRESRDARLMGMENPTTRGPVEQAAQRYALLAEKLEAARKRGHS
jgi:hypothetical protein